MAESDETKAPAAAPAAAPADAPADASGYGKEMKGTMFPYIDNAQHWDIDFNDTHQSYEGSALPPWILTGFTVFVLWAIVYMIFALT